MALVVGRHLVTTCATVRTITDMVCGGGDRTFLTSWAWATGGGVGRGAGYMALVVHGNDVTAWVTAYACIAYVAGTGVDDT
jgi:hypothetical protein